MGKTIDDKLMRSEVIDLAIGINVCFAERYNTWEKKARNWVASRADELLPPEDREHLVEEISKDTPRILLLELSDEWPVEKGLVESLAADIKPKVEALKDTYGVEVALKIVDAAASWMRRKAAQLVQVEFDKTLNTLNWLYEDAKEVTIMEFLTQSNHEHVIKYHEALREKLWEMHYEAVEWHEAKILSEVAKAMDIMADDIVPKPKPQVIQRETYYCRECGTPFYRGDVFCSNYNCGRLITYMDYDN